MQKDLKQALEWAWLVVSAGLLVSLAAVWLLPEDAVLGIGAALQSPHPDQETCILCGMTRAFAAITRGDLAAALEYNRGSIALFGLILFNGLLASRILARTLAGKAGWWRRRAAAARTS